MRLLRLPSHICLCGNYAALMSLCECVELSMSDAGAWLAAKQINKHMSDISRGPRSAQNRL
jgi:hypothetical protein